MTGAPREDDRPGVAGAAEVFQRHRDRLRAIAYGILGSAEDADDVVQEAYVRWHGAERDPVRSPEAWLVATVRRLCIDRLRARQAERKAYLGPWLPTSLVSVAPPPDGAAGRPRGGPGREGGPGRGAEAEEGGGRWRSEWPW